MSLLVVQLMPKSAFTKGFVEFTLEAFSDLDIRFILCGDDSSTGYRKPKSTNYISCESYTKAIGDPLCQELFRDCDLLILNWVDLKAASIGLRPYWDKLVLMFWGGDAYPFQQRRNPVLHGKYWLKRHFLSQAIKNAKGIVTLVPGDLEKVEVICQSHGRWKLGCVPTETREEAELARDAAILAHAQSRNSPLRVLLGNSATPTNRHAEALNLLSRYAVEDIEVFVPLSYGDERYRDEVIDVGCRLLGSRFVPMLEFMDREDYYRFLSTVDIGVFNHCRQQGLGNIWGLLRSGKKVFISDESPMWDNFRQDGLHVRKTSDIAGLSFHQFVAFDELDAQRNMKVLDPVRKYAENVALWESIYSLALEPRFGE